MNQNLSRLSGIMANLNDLKSKNSDISLPSSYADALKRHGLTVENIQKSLKIDAAHTVFEKDKGVSQCSLFVPDLTQI